MDWWGGFATSTSSGHPPPRSLRTPSPSFAAVGSTADISTSPSTTARSALERWIGDTYFTAASAVGNTTNTSSLSDRGIIRSDPRSRREITTAMTSNNNNSTSPTITNSDEDGDEWARLTIRTNNNSNNLETMANLATANALATTELLNARLIEHMSGRGDTMEEDGASGVVDAHHMNIPGGSPLTSAAVAARSPGFDARYTLDFGGGNGGSTNAPAAAAASSASRTTSTITNNGGVGNINISSSSSNTRRSSFTPVTTSSTTTTTSATTHPHQRRQQQRLRDYQRQQQQQQLRNYERQYQQRLRSNLITASMTSSIARQQQQQQQQVQRELMDLEQELHQGNVRGSSRSVIGGGGSVVVGGESGNFTTSQHLEQSHMQSHQPHQQRRHIMHPYLPRTSRSSLQSIQRARSLQGIRQRRFQQRGLQHRSSGGVNGANGNIMGDEEFSTSDWNAYQSVREELNDRSTALDSAAAASAAGGNDDGEEEEEMDGERVLRRVGELFSLSAESGGGEEEEEGVFSLSPTASAARPSSSTSDDSSTMPELELVDQQGSGSDGGSPSTTTTSASSSSSAASSASAVNVPSSTTTSTALPTRRSRRQAAVRGMERISAAIATGGMGSDYTSNDSDDSKKQPHKKSSKTTPQEAAKKPSTLNKTATCCICLEIPTEEELSTINGCNHPYCFTCIETWANRENTCPLCKARFTKIEKVNFVKKKRKRGGGSEMNPAPEGRKSKKVRNRNQRADINMTNPLQGLFGECSKMGVEIK